jgi:hypothetical protein
MITKQSLTRDERAYLGMFTRGSVILELIRTANKHVIAILEDVETRDVRVANLTKAQVELFKT